MGKIQWKSLIISLLISLGTGAVSALLSQNIMEKYEAMYQPPLSPPGWVFPIVWTILYLLMGTAAYLIYVSGSVNSEVVLKLYFAQLAVNAGWSIIFFGFGLFLLAFTWLLLLWYLVLLTTISFYAIHPTAGKLMIPYLLWLIFAAYLNLAVVIHYMQK